MKDGNGSSRGVSSDREKVGSLRLVTTVNFYHEPCTNPEPHPKHQKYVVAGAAHCVEIGPVYGSTTVDNGTIIEVWCEGVREKVSVDA